MNLAPSYLPLRALSYRSKPTPPYGRAASAPVTIRCYGFRISVARLRRVARNFRRRFPLPPARRLRSHSHGDSLLRPPRCTRALVVGISMGGNRARDARHAQLLLADD